MNPLLVWYEYCAQRSSPLQEVQLEFMLAVGTIVAKERHSHSLSHRTLLSFCSFHMILRQAINIRRLN